MFDRLKARLYVKRHLSELVSESERLANQEMKAFLNAKDPKEKQEHLEAMKWFSVDALMYRTARRKLT